MFKKVFQRLCCLCFGFTPRHHCDCPCHRQDDCEFWETVGVAWICDVEDGTTREELWQRFIIAYPQCGGESASHFWERIQKTRWFDKNRHRFEHHHPYAGDCLR